MSFAGNLDRTCVRVPLLSRERMEAITELVDLLHAAGRLADRDTVLSAVLDRERARSTGIGLGLAVPHGKSGGCDRCVVAVGRPASPIPFDAVDGRPCEMIVLLASPTDQTGPHIQALSGVSRWWQNEANRRSALEARDAGELFALLAGSRG